MRLEHPLWIHYIFSIGKCQHFISFPFRFKWLDLCLMIPPAQIKAKIVNIILFEFITNEIIYMCSFFEKNEIITIFIFIVRSLYNDTPWTLKMASLWFFYKQVFSVELISKIQQQTSCWMEVIPSINFGATLILVIIWLYFQWETCDDVVLSLCILWTCFRLFHFY